MKAYIIFFVALALAMPLRGCLIPPPPKIYYYKQINYRTKDDVKMESRSLMAYQKYIFTGVDFSLVNTGAENINLNGSDLDLKALYRNIAFDTVRLWQETLDKRLIINNKEVTKFKKFKVLPNDTLSLEFILTPQNRDIPQNEFLQYWKEDTLKLRLRVKDKFYHYAFVADVH